MSYIYEETMEMIRSAVGVSRQECVDKIDIG
jgi:hypothetical protein